MFNENDEENVKTFILIGTNIILVFAMFILVLALLFTAKKRKLLKANLTLTSFYEQEILKTQLEIREQTLKNISQEIHDNIGQVLSLTKMNLFTIDPQNQEQLVVKLENSKTLVSKAITDLRSLSHSLNTDYIEQLGLSRAIESELELLGRSGVLKTNFCLEGSIRKFEKQKEIIIFRIFQETLNNIVKHANASQVYVHLDFSVNPGSLRISDDGKGFNIDAILNNGAGRGIGLKNMQSRAGLIGADLSFSSNLENGTEIKLQMPPEV